MRLALAHARAETLQFARYPAYSLPTLAFPAILMLIVGPRSREASPSASLRGSPPRRS